MALQLTIIKFPPGVSLSEDRKVFEAGGGLIGRGADNDWVLSDPERFLSSKHCQITCENNNFYLVDLSTNGTFVNGGVEPVGRGQRVALNDGDRFDVGDYRFKVSLLGDANPFPVNPFGSKDSPSLLAGKSGGFGKPAADAGAFMSNSYGGEINDITPDELRITDPLVAIDNAMRRDSGDLKNQSDDGLFDYQTAGLGEEPQPRGSQDDAGDFFSDALDWPKTTQESGLLPDDWDDDISLLRGKKDPAGDALQGALSGETLSAGKGYRLPDDDSLIVQRELGKAVEPKPKPTEAGRRTGAGRSQRTAQDILREKQKLNAAQNRPTADNNKTLGGADRSLVDALGLRNVAMSDDQIRQINADVGIMMRETLEGLMQILRSRASIKNEFRINITTIQPVENNPIKFSANVDEIVELMFVRRSKAYKGPIEAVKESFNTIADHQLAVIAGIRSAFRAALGRFDPVILEEDFKQMGKSGVLPGIFKGSLWGAYQSHYQKMVNDMERSFQDLFGDEFVQAYEEQLNKLAQARKRDV